MYRDTYPLSHVYIYISIFSFRKKSPHFFRSRETSEIRSVSAEGQCCHLLLVRTCHCGQSSPDGRFHGRKLGPPQKRCRIILNQASHWKRCKHCENSGRVNLRIMIPKKHILQYLEVDFNIFPMISTIYDQLKIHTMECLRPQRWSGGTGGTEVPPA